MKLHLPKRLTAALAALYTVATPLVTTVGTGILTIGGLAALSTACVVHASDYYTGPDTYGHNGATTYYLTNEKDTSGYTLDVTAYDTFWIVGDNAPTSTANPATVRTLNGLNAKAGASMNIGWSAWHSAWGLDITINALTIGDGTGAAVLNVDPGSGGAVINAHIKNVSGVLSSITNGGTLTLGDAAADGHTIVVSAPITNSGTLSFAGSTRFEIGDLSAYEMVDCSLGGVEPGQDGLGKEIRTYNLITNTAEASVQGVDNITFSLEGVTANAGDGGNVTFSIAGEEDIYIIQSEAVRTTTEAAQLGATKVSVSANSTINCNSANIGLDRISGEGHVIVSTNMSLTGSKASEATGRLTVTNNATLTVGGGDSQTNSLSSFTSVYLDSGTIRYNNRNDTLNNVTVEAEKSGTIHSQDMGPANANKLTLSGTTTVNGTLSLTNYWNAQFEIATLVGSGSLTIGSSEAANENAAYTINLGAFTGTLNVNEDKATVTLQGNVNGAAITKTRGTLKYTGTSVTDSTLTGVVLAGSERVTVSGTVNIADMVSCDLTNSTHGYAFIGSGILNFSGVSDLTRNSEGTAATHSKIGMEGGSTINVLSGASLTVGGLVNTDSNLASNASLNVNDNATLVLDETSADNYIASITNNGTITVRGALTTGGVINNGGMSIQNTASFGSLTNSEGGTLTVMDGVNLTIEAGSVTNGATLDVAGTLTTTGTLDFNGLYIGASSNALRTSGNGEIIFGEQASIDVSHLTSVGGSNDTDGFASLSYRVTESDTNARIAGESIRICLGDASLGTGTWNNGIVTVGDTVYNVAGTKKYSEYLAEAQATNQSAARIVVQDSGTFEANQTDQDVAITGTGTLEAAWKGRAQAGADVSNAAKSFNGNVVVKSKTSWLIGDDYSFSSVTVEDGGQFGLDGTYTGNITISGLGVAGAAGETADHRGALKFGNGGTLNGNVIIVGEVGSLSTWNTHVGNINGNITASTESGAKLEVMNGNGYGVGANTINLSGNLSGIKEVVTHGGTLNVEGTIGNYGETFTKSGEGTLTLTGAHTLTNDKIAVNGGSLLASELTMSGSSITTAEGADVRITSALTANGSGNSIGHLALGENITLTTSANASLTVQKFSVRSEAAANQELKLEGRGTLTIAGESNFRAVYLSGTNLKVEADTTMTTLFTRNGSQNSTVTVSNGAKLTMDNFSSPWGIGTMTVDGTLDCAGAFVISSGGIVNTINGGGAINVASLHVQNAATKASFSGVTLNLGSGGIASSNNSSQSNCPIEFKDMTIGVAEEATAWSSSLNTIHLEGTETGTKFAPSAGKSITISGNMSGAGKLVKTDDGTLVLSGANTYSGGTSVTQGTLKANSADALGTEGTVAVAGGTLEIGAAVDLGDRLTQTGGAIVVTGTGRLTLSTAAISSSIQNEGTLTITGSITAEGLAVTSSELRPDEGTNDFLRLQESLAVVTGTGSVVANDVQVTQGGKSYTLDANGTASLITYDYSTYCLTTGDGSVAEYAGWASQHDGTLTTVEMTSNGTLTVDADLTTLNANTLGGTVNITTGAVQNLVVNADTTVMGLSDPTVVEIAGGATSTLTGGMSTSGISFSGDGGASIENTGEGSLNYGLDAADAKVKADSLTATGGDNVSVANQLEVKNIVNNGTGILSVTGTVDSTEPLESIAANNGDIAISNGVAVQNLTVKEDKTLRVQAAEGVSSTIIVTREADIAGAVSADVTVQSGDANNKATFAANNGATVGGNLTVTDTGALEIANENSLTVNGLLELKANSVLNLSDLVSGLGITQKDEAQTFTIATAGSFLIGENITVDGLEGFSWTLTSSDGAINLESPASAGTNTEAPAMFSMRRAATATDSPANTLTLTILGLTQTPDTLTATEVVTYDSSNGTLNINVAEADKLALLVGKDQNLSVTVGSEAWAAIVAEMDGNVYQNATITLNGESLDQFGTVSFNGYTGTGVTGEYFVAYIPEPATATLSLLALASLAARRRRK